MVEHFISVSRSAAPDGVRSAVETLIMQPDDTAGSTVPVPSVLSEGESDTERVRFTLNTEMQFKKKKKKLM